MQTEVPPPVYRRTVLASALVAAGTLAASTSPLAAQPHLFVDNVTGLYRVEVAGIATPRDSTEVIAALRAWPGGVAVGGGRYSMGGQVALQQGLHLDLRQMNRLVWLKPEALAVRVQAGMRWRDLQHVIDPHGLAVKTMQSFSNFSIGGSISVNVHGRYVGHGPVGNTVRAMQLVLADGSTVEASRTENQALFRAAIGGYGAVGIITEVELDLAENRKIQRVVESVPLHLYPEFFRDSVLGRHDSVLHNADLLPPDFDAPISVTWRRAGHLALTVQEKLVARGQTYGFEQNAIWAMTELPGGNVLRRSVVQPLLTRDPVVKWLNHEASADVASLEPRTRLMSTYVLQEYFIPERHFAAFARDMAEILRRQRVDALNVSIRHSPADDVSLMAWAREPVFSFVLYFKQRTWAEAREVVGRWTRELVELALKWEGRYYLPYQLHPTRNQFDRAYPEAEQLRQVKASYDPRGRFSNELWKKYL